MEWDDSNLTLRSGIWTRIKHAWDKHSLSKPEAFNIFDEWYEFKVLEKGLKHCELLNDVLSDSESFTVLEKLLSIVSILSVCIVKEASSFLNLIKSWGQQWKQTA